MGSLGAVLAGQQVKKSKIDFLPPIFVFEKWPKSLHIFHNFHKKEPKLNLRPLN